MRTLISVLKKKENEPRSGVRAEQKMQVVRKAFDSLRGWKIALFILAVFTFQEVYADSKPGESKPLWVPSICGKFEFSAWDKINAHPPYHLKFVVRRTIYTYTAEKLSDNTGFAPNVKFPDDFFDNSGRPAHLTSSCAIGKLIYEIYVDDARLESGEVNVDFKVDD